MSDQTASHGLGVFTAVHEAIARTRGLTAMAFAALLGAFCALGFAPFHFTPVLIMSFTGLVWMLDGARSRVRWGRAIFARGWAFGFGFFLVSMYWTALPFLVEPEKDAIYLWMPLIGLPGGMALIWGVACLLGGAFWSSSPSRMFIFVLFMGGAELVRGTLFGGFPWNLAGTSWVPGGPVSQAASLGGVYWLTLMTLFVAVAPAALVDTRDMRGLVGRALPTVMAIALLGFGWAWGSQRLATETVMTERTVQLMDVGVPQARKFDNGGAPVLLRYIQLAQLPSEPEDILIWPEGALPNSMLLTPTGQDQVNALLRGRTLIAGTAWLSESGARNSLFVFRQGRVGPVPLGHYDKHRLVPFGELAAEHIVPFGTSISGLLPDAMQRNFAGGFTPGNGPVVVDQTDYLPAFIPLICYEGLFPEMVRKAGPQREAAEWIVVISNDAWFGGGLGPAQHYAQNRYRAIESGLPLARVATRGATAMIDGYGRQVARGEPVEGDPEGWRSAVVRTPLPAALDRTPYQRFGETFYWLTLVVLAGLAFASWRR